MVTIAKIYPQRQLRRVDHLPGNTRLLYTRERNSLREAIREAIKSLSPTLFGIHTNFVDFPEKGEIFEFGRGAFCIESIPGFG